METKTNMVRGMSRREAERQARLTLGRPLHALSNFLHDGRQAIRSLRRDLTFTLLALITLALAIGAMVLVFAVTNSVLLTPLPFPEPDRLVMVWERSPAGDVRNYANSFNIAQWQARTTTLESIGAVVPFSLNISGVGDTEQVDGQIVSSGFFAALGTPPLLGRTFTRADDSPTGLLQHRVVLSHQFWQRRYHGARDVIGRQLVVNGNACDIIGVMPPGFSFPALGVPELYMLMTLNPAGPPGGRSFMTVARLKPRVTIDGARADVQRIAAQLAREVPQVDRGWSASVFALFDETVAPIRRALWVVFGAVACLLLLACANVANLLLMRLSRRAPELAVRTALGAGRLRILQHVLVESVALTVAAAIAGILLTKASLPILVRTIEESTAMPRVQEIAIHWRTAALVLLAAVVIGLIFTGLQATATAYGRVDGLLRAATRSTSASHARLRRALVILEMAVALVLVFAATLMGRSLAELYRVDPGFRPDSILTMRMALSPRKYVQPPQSAAFVERLLENVRATPGVNDASSIHFLPLSGMSSGAPVFRSDRPAPPRESLPSNPVSVIAPHYFSTMGIPLRGRDFDSRDRLDTPKAVIVNEALAKSQFPGEEPIGKALKIRYSSDADYRIVGVAGDVRTDAIDQPPGPAVYLAQSQEPSLTVALVVRTTGDRDRVAGAIRNAVSRIDPEQGVKEVAPFDDVIARATARPRVEASVFGTFGVLGLLIAAIGVYAVIAYGVEQRHREIGILLALGATPSAVLRGVIGEGMALTVIGTGIGLLLALAASRALSGLLYGISARDPLMLFVVTGALVGVAAAASLAPARRATRVDPLLVLRAE